MFKRTLLVYNVYDSILNLFLENPRDRPAPLIQAIDHNQKVFEGGRAILRCILPSSSEVNIFYVFYSTGYKESSRIKSRFI